ncbi:MAG TPA: MASE1 domain-containing protein, partial [Myxococcota bacterium]|nr:MASE1 domain-containing protein [Myxococcota bacterium]
MGTALALLYWLAALHSISFACTPGGVSPVWSATGIGIAGLKLLGRRFWPAVALGSLGLNLSVHPSPVVVLWLTLASTIEALLGASLVDWATRRKALLMESRHAIGVVIAAVVAPLPCAALGVTTLVAQGLIPSTAIWECFHTWWIADGVGTLIIVPGVVSLVWLVRSGALPSVNTVLRSLVLTLLAGATVALVFSNTLAPPFLYLLFPLLLLATVWFRHHGAHLLIGAVAIFMVWGWTWGRDVFNGDGDNAQLVHLQIFLCSL